MLAYFKGLKRPDDWAGLVELLSKTLFAFIAAIIASGTWLYVKRDESHKAELAALRAQTTDKREIINLFVNVMPDDIAEPKAEVRLLALRSYCDEEYKPASANLLLKSLCEKVGTFGESYAVSSNASAVQAIAVVESSGDATDYIGTKAATEQSLALATTEAAGPVKDQAKWFAVVASVPMSQAEGAVSLAKSLNRKMPGIGLQPSVHIYETKISGSYALTSGSAKSEKDARARVRVLRQSGLVADAFAQPDRDWTLSKLQPASDAP